MFKSNSHRNLLHSDIFWRVGRSWLILLLCFMPFEFYILKSIALWNSSFSKALSRFDLITIIILFPVALLEIFKTNKNIKWPYIVLLFPLIFIGSTGIVSGLINGNSLFVTLHGIFQYIRYFLVIFIFSSFFKEFNALKKVYRYLIIIILCLAAAAIIQEFWAYVSRYVFDKTINDSSIYLFQRMRPDGVLASFWRFGFYRVSPFFNSPIIFGLYSILIMTIYICVEMRIRLSVLLPIVIASALSFSRIVYLSATLIFVFQGIKGRKGFFIAAIPFLVISLLFMIAMNDLSDWNLNINIPFTAEYEDAPNHVPESFRSHSREKAIEIWKDYPLWGVGPGMFGGVVSVKYHSSVYEEYNFSLTNLLERIMGIDQFWFQVIAEIGVIGIAGYVTLFFSIILICRFAKNKAEQDELKGLFQGLIIFSFIIVIYAFGITINIKPVIFTYSAIVGMGLGCVTKS